MQGALHELQRVLEVVQHDVTAGPTQGHSSLARGLVREGSRGAEAQHLANGKQVPHYVSHASQLRHP